MEDRLEEEIMEELPAKKRGKWWIIALIIIIIAVAAWFGWKYYKQHHQKPVTSSLPTTQVRRGNIQVNVSGTGSVQPVNTSTVKSSTQGTIKKVLIKQGDKVKKGETIATLDLQSIQDQITQNNLTLQKDQLNLTQTEDQLKQATDQSSIDNFKMQIESTQLDINSVKEKNTELEQQLQSSTIVAPMSGTVDSVSVSNGDSVNGSATIAQITDYSKMELVTAVDELDIAKVKLGQTATITIDALPNQTFTGKVTDIAKQGQSSNGVATFNVTLTLDNSKNVLSGMSAEASILVQSKQNILMLPIEAVQTIGNKYYVTLPSTSTSGSANGQSQGNSSSQWQRGNSSSSQSQNSSSGAKGNTKASQNSGSKNSASKNSGSQNNASQSSGSKNKASQNSQSSNRFTSRRGNLQEVQVGIHNENYIQIVSGLTEGESVDITLPTASSSGSQSRFGGGMGGLGAVLGGGGGGGYHNRGGN